MAIVMVLLGLMVQGKVLFGFDIEGTRPTMDRVKESMFGCIQSYIRGSVCLDLFAGSGSLGIEALSNGADKCYFVEKHNDIYNVLLKNLIGIDCAFFIKKDYFDALNMFVSERLKFDIIFLDPPYKFNLINGILDYIYVHDLLNDGGIVVCEFENENVFCERFNLIKSRKYGSKNLFIYKKL